VAVAGGDGMAGIANGHVFHEVYGDATLPPFTRCCAAAG